MNTRTHFIPQRPGIRASPNRAALRPRRPTVLVIQRSEAVCELLANILRQQGFVVLAATTFEAGLGAAGLSRVDLVIADYRYPDPRAQRYLQVLRCTPQPGAGEFELVAKPFAVEGLLAAIGRLLAAEETGLVSPRWLAGSGAQHRARLTGCAGLNGVAEPTLPLPLAV